MANSAISGYTELTGANTASDDLFEIVDTSTTSNKKIQASELGIALSSRMLVLGTEQASTSGTSIDFTSIPSWAKRITIQLVGVSTNGTSNLLVQIGDSGGVEATGYLCGTVNLVDTASVAGGNATNGYLLTAALAAGSVVHGSVVLTLQDAAQFTWVANSTLGFSNAAVVAVSAGSKSLSAALDRVRITTFNGTDAFDAGAINILYE